MSIMVISKSDRYRLSQALRQAETSRHHRYRHGAVLVKNGNIVARSANISKNDPAQMGGSHRCTVHAEVAVLRKSPNNTNGAVLYVARIGALGNPALSRPCPACATTMQDHRVSRVVWTVDAQTMMAARVRDLVEVV